MESRNDRALSDAITAERCGGIECEPPILARLVGCAAGRDCQDSEPSLCQRPVAIQLRSTVRDRQREEHENEDRKRIVEAREKHLAIEPGVLNAGYHGLLEAELAKFRSQLSPGGWLELERALAPKQVEGNVTTYTVAAP